MVTSRNINFFLRVSGRLIVFVKQSRKRFGTSHLYRDSWTILTLPTSGILFEADSWIF